MVNIDDFIKKLEAVLEYYNLNASTFADKIGVQRSSMSHLLSGRNKPSLDFILKIIDVFPEIDLYWILIGKGSFPKSNEALIPKKEIISNNLKRESPSPSPIEDLPTDLFSEIKTPIPTNFIENQKNETVINRPNEISSNNLEKIVFFYMDGTFKVYSSN